MVISCENLQGYARKSINFPPIQKKISNKETKDHQ